MLDTLKFKKERSIYIDGTIDQTMATTVIKTINEQRAEAEEALGSYEYHFHKKVDLPPMKLYMNSYGGEVLSALGIYDYIRAWEGDKSMITSVGIGMVASAALFPFLASNERYCYPHTRFLIHSVSGGVWGAAKDIDDYSRETKVLIGYINEIILSRTNITKEYLDEISNSKIDKWIGAKDAVELGICQDIIR
jgi:ATP-dependent Clp protease protease subunit